MSTVRWIGNAAGVKQVTTATPANVEIGDIFTLTINSKTISFTATAATVANVVDGLTDEWNESVYAEAQEITATGSSGTEVTLTGNEFGVPFTVTGSTTDGGGTDDQTLSVSTTTAATGPNHWSNAANWSGGAVPVNSDDVYIDQGDTDILYGLDQSAVTLTSLTVSQAYTGTIGLPVENSNGYYEYRDTELAIAATTLSIGTGEGGGSSRIKINTGSAQTTVNVSNSGQPTTQGIPAIQWRGTHSSNAANISKGSFGAAFYADQSATIATLNVGYLNNQEGDSDVYCGSGTTLTTVNQTGGKLSLNSAATTITVNGGTLTFNAGTLTTLTVEAGTTFYRSTGTITTANVGSDGVLDFTQDQRGRTITNLVLHDGFAYRDPFGTVTLSNGADFYHCSPVSGEFAVKDHQTWTPSSI